MNSWRCIAAGVLAMSLVGPAHALEPQEPKSNSAQPALPLQLAQHEHNEHHGEAMHDDGHGHDAHGHAAAMDDPVIREWVEINDRMHEGMMFDFTGDPDVDFALGMILHHQGAIDMARVVLEHGDDPGIRELAEEIIAAQEEEIAFLRSWLEERGY